MKTLLTSIVLLILFSQINAQNIYVSNEQLKTMDGTNIQLGEILSQQGTILIFWETNSSQCCSNLDNLQESWVQRVENYGVDLIGICIDSPGMWVQVKPYVAGKGWEFDTYMDTNGNLKRALGVITTPYTILLDGEQNIRCRYPGYCSGDENQICDKIIHCLEDTGNLADL